MSPSFTGVVAMDATRGIGLNNGIPWRLKEDTGKNAFADY